VRTEETTATAPGGALSARLRGVRERLARPGTVLLVLLALTLVMGWQFITDAARAVPAFDTAYYQWRAEFLLANPPGALIELRGATGALAGGYRVAEPVLGALMRRVGGVGAFTHTVVLSVMFRVLAALAVAAFAWKHRRSWVLFYLSLLAIPALFLLQRFFGYMDNFMSLALIAGVLLLLRAMRTSWLARVTATLFMFLAGLSHPTTLAIFLLSMGAVAGYRLIRERFRIRAVLRSEGPVLSSGVVAVAMTAAFWLGGLWGPTSSFSDAAVPPPASVQYFVDRSVGVLKNLQPFDQAAAPSLLVWGGVAALVGLMLWGLLHLLRRLWTGGEYFAEVTVAWTLPLAGMAGFLIGAAYPYFRFFNGTLAPLLLAAVGMALFVRAGLRRSTGLGLAAVVVMGVLLGGWWYRGISAWNATGTWLTPEIRSGISAARGALRVEGPDRGAVFVVDAQPVEGQSQLPYGKYKEYVNASYALMGGDLADDTEVYFGTIEDFRAGRATATGDEVYDDIAADTAEATFAFLEERPDALVMMPEVFNEASDPNASFLEGCGEECVEIGDSGTFVVVGAGGEVSPDALRAGGAAGEEARAFAQNPPGPLSGIGGTILDVLRLFLLFGFPGLILWLGLPDREFVDGFALVPLASIALTTTVGVVLVAILRGPITGLVGWLTWGLAVVLAGVLRAVVPERERAAAGA
jgi:hypothetical protein